MQSLLDSAFIKELSALERRVNIVARSGMAGERMAFRRGSSAEFEQHRPYVPGDDLRRIDWLATARSGSPVLKQFRSEEDPIVRVLLDRSLSLSIGVPSKLWLAKRIAAAAGYLGLKAGARVQLLCAPGDDGSSVQWFDPRRGQHSLHGYLRQLDGAEPRGGTHLATWVRDVVLACKRPGLLLLISDFFDPEPVLRELDLARGQGHEIALCQVIAPEECDPDFDGDVQLLDAESGHRLELTLDQAALDSYVTALLDLFERLRAWSKQRGQGYVRVTTSADLVGAMKKLVFREQD